MLVGGAFDNRPGGTLIWLKTTTGVVCRQINLKHGPVGPLTMGFIGDSPICVFTAVDGTVAAINWSGDLLWELERSDAALRYSLNGPLVAGSFVLSGDCRGIDCQRLSDGAIVWSSGPFGTPENLLSYGSAISVNDHIVIPLGGPGIGLVCFRADTGEVIWRELGQRGIPASGIRVDGSRGYLVRSTGTVDCFEIETGRLIWCQHLCSSLGGPMPIICGEKLIAVTSDGYGGVFDKKSGTCDRMFKVTSPAVRVGAYRNVSTFVTGLDLLADSIWISCADGSIHSAVMDEEIGSFMPIIQRNVLTTSSAQFLNLDSAIVLGFEGRLELVEIPGSLQPSRLETQS
jgi:outer membrane protein assembly factor BamB